MPGVCAAERLRMVAGRRTDFRGLRSTPAVRSLGNGPEGNVRESRNRPQGRYQFSRGDPSGSLLFAVGTDVPSASQPLSSATLGGAWKVACLGPAGINPAPGST